MTRRIADREPVVLIDQTASLRRQARLDAAVLLQAAGWNLGRIALAFGISQRGAADLLPRERSQQGGSDKP